MTWATLGYRSCNDGAWGEIHSDDDFLDVEVVEDSKPEFVAVPDFGLLKISSESVREIYLLPNDAPRSAMKPGPLRGVFSSDSRPERSTGQKDESDYVSLRRRQPKPEFTMGSYWNLATREKWKGHAPSDKQLVAKSRELRETPKNPITFIPLKGQHILHTSASPLSKLAPDGQIRNRLTIGSPNCPTTKHLWPEKKAKK
jgi:hypothetical protein